MHPHPIDIQNLLWFAGWLVAVAVLFAFALRLPLQVRLNQVGARLFAAAVLTGIVAVGVLANVALSLHDRYFDLTREAVFTPADEALAVVDNLKQPVRLIYYYRGDDQGGRRAADIWQVMGRRNVLLDVRTLDPDKEPSLAKSDGLKLYNTAVLEASGRRISVSSTDEIEIAIGIQRVLREKVITACFLEGHKEYPMDAFEFHTHFEGSSGHEHGDSSSAIVQTTGHGIGRLRRLLEGLGYDTLAITPATQGDIPALCTVVINAGPRTTYLPEETRALTAYLEQGGSLLLMYDLGFVLEPGLEQLLEKLGFQFPQQVLQDPKSHYGKDIETLAVTAYAPHPITRDVSMTFFPGTRPLKLVAPADGIRTKAIVTSSDESVAVTVRPLAQRTVGSVSSSNPNQSSKPGSHAIAAIAEGRLSATASQDFRVAVTGDADFASNSFIPYMANSDLSLSLIRWLVHEERDTVIASRIPVPSLVLLTDNQSRWVFLLLVVFLPLSVMLTGIVVWWRRR